MLGILDNIAAQKLQQKRVNLRRDLLHYGARIGGKVFGPVPKGHRREFFCLDETTWVWHEEWLDDKGQRHIVTTRYDVRPEGILKSQGNNSYQKLSDQEVRNLVHAANLYYERFGSELQRLIAHNG